MKLFSIILVTILTTLLFQNCQRGSNTDFSSFAPEFTPHLRDFQKSAQTSGYYTSFASLKIDFFQESDFPSTTIGFCYKQPLLNEKGEWQGLTPIILFRKSYWDSKPEYKRRDLIFHELGHCLLNRVHPISIPKEDLIGGFSHLIEKQPNLSLMNPIALSSVLSEEEYKNIQPNLDEELFASALKLSVNEQRVNHQSENMKTSTPEANRFTFDDLDTCHEE